MRKINITPHSDERRISELTIRDERPADQQFHGMGLAPLSVATSYRNSGIGTSLVEAGLNRLVKNDCPFAVVLGHPDYYPRFGFQPAHKSGISHGFANVPQEVFFIITLTASAVQSTPTGSAFYNNKFGPQHQ